jgi:transposase
MKETLTLNQKEQKRLLVMNGLLAGSMAAGKAAELLGLSVRQVRRILAAYRKDGAAALAHGNRDRRPVNVVAESARERVVELARTKYAGFNHLHMSEKLREEEKLPIAHSSVRRLLLEAGIASPRKRRAPKHRSRRERCPKEGMLLQMDGSPHDWLEGRGPVMSLLAGIDDATGTVPYAIFRLQEDTLGYFLLLQGIVDRKGCPVAIYRDRHSIFETSTKAPMSLQEQLAGRREPTQFGRLLEELGITSIPARSPQAKGRIERLWGTLQSRLVSEMRLKGVTDLEEANRFLVTFLHRYNRRFAVPAAEEGSAWRPLPEDMDPHRVFCLKQHRVVAADNTVSLSPHRLQLLPSAQRASYARAEVEICEQLNGSLVVYHQGQPVPSRPAPLEASALRTQAEAKGAREGQQGPSQPSPAPRKPRGNPDWGRHFTLPHSSKQKVGSS